MALDVHTLESVCREGFGPLALVADGAGWNAAFEGGRASVALDGPTVRARSSVAIEWPSGKASTNEIDLRVALVLRGLALSRSELCTIRANESRRSVDVTAWIDAASSSVIDLAQLVRTTIALSATAAALISQVRVGVAAEDRAAEAAQFVVEEVERARGMLGALDSDFADSPVVDSPVVDGPVVESPAGPPPGPRPAAAPSPPAAAPSPPPPPPSPPPPPPSPPPRAPSARPGAFSPTHRIAAQGARTWPAPDSSQKEGPALPGGLQVQFLARQDAWAHVRCSNDWTAWIDARMLDER